MSKLLEDLRKWFDPNHPEGGWKRINSKGEAIGPCAREPGEAKPKCMSNAKRASLTKKERAAAVKAKRRHDSDPERKGKPINVSNYGKGKLSENMEQLDEKNVPTSPEKWARAKAQAKAKFDVYPSAYANGWAAKKYKEMGGGWKSVNEGKEDKREYDYEGDMIKSDLRSIIANANRLIDMLEDSDNLPEWCQSKITLAEDYVSTVANYMTAEMNEEVELDEWNFSRGGDSEERNKRRFKRKELDFELRHEVDPPKRSYPSRPARYSSTPSTKIYHKVPYAQKDDAKKEGMRFDGDKKKWYHTDASKSTSSKFQKEEVEQINEVGDTAKGQKRLNKVLNRAIDRINSKKGEQRNKAEKSGSRAWERLQKEEKHSEVFNNIRFAKNTRVGKDRIDVKHTGPSTDDEEHYTVGSVEFAQQLKHVKKRAMQESKQLREFAPLVALVGATAGRAAAGAVARKGASAVAQKVAGVAGNVAGQYAANRVLNKKENGQVSESRKSQIVKDIAKKKKSDKFEPNPELTDRNSPEI